MRPEISHCNSCRAPIYWLANATTGKVAPIDATVAKDGNVVIEDDHYRVLSKREREDITIAFGTRHKNHFATCPHAQKWGSDR